MKFQVDIDIILIKYPEGGNQPILFNILITLAYQHEWKNVIVGEIRRDKLVPMKTIVPPYPTDEEVGPLTREANIHSCYVVTKKWDYCYARTSS
jgi:hypothetical protein